MISRVPSRRCRGQWEPSGGLCRFELKDPYLALGHLGSVHSSSGDRPTAFPVSAPLLLTWCVMVVQGARRNSHTGPDLMLTARRRDGRSAAVVQRAGWGRAHDDEGSSDGAAGNGSTTASSSCCQIERRSVWCHTALPRGGSRARFQRPAIDAQFRERIRSRGSFHQFPTTRPLPQARVIGCASD